MGWLAEVHPELVPRYRQLYGSGAYAQKDYRSWLAKRISPLIRQHGLERGREDPVTGGVRSTALGRIRTADGGSSLIAEELPPSAAASLPAHALAAEPTLF
jgi:hypothetical protein